MPPIPALPPAHAFENATPHLFDSIPQYYTPLDRQTQPTYTHPVQTPLHQEPPKMSARGPRIKTDPSTTTSSMPPLPRQNPNPNNINITTKFPVARIKRIMQADEEIGKVSQVTPIAVSKALELFMINLVEGAAEKARARGGKKVGGRELKEVVMGRKEKWDFLEGIVGRVKDGPEGGEAKRKKEKGAKEENSEESEEEERKTKKRGGGRRKKGDE